MPCSEAEGGRGVAKRSVRPLPSHAMMVQEEWWAHGRYVCRREPICHIPGDKLVERPGYCSSAAAPA